ncbi:MAG: TIGR03560 family F420-dependent LLM class oxidoreductase [Acidimicrobiaceae bacterium]|nr:TIGR03560 family F420-dependent LLM class oxidoreductase [Acidimicrobiaceae bacterium]
MRFSIWPSSAWTWEEIRDLALHCEATGWDRVYFADHFMPNSPSDATPVDGNTVECWSVLSGLAATVPRLGIAPLVTSVTYRHPAVLANIAAAVDNMSGGRLVLGVGAGWQLNEHAAYGIDLGSITERLDRFEEACRVVLSLLRENRTSFDGTYYHLADAPNQPRPVQERVPLLIGGRGERRTMRIAAALADEWNTWTTPEVLAHKVDVLHRHCEDLGRDPSDVAVSTQAPLFLSTDETWLERIRQRDMARESVVGTPDAMTEIMAAYTAAGADEFIVTGPTLGDRVRRVETCDLFIEEVAPAFR